MQRFTFQLEGVLRHKHWLEDEAKRKLGVAVQKRIILQQELKDIDENHKTILQERSQTANLSPKQHLSFIQYGHKLLQQKEDKKKEIDAQNIAIDLKQQHLNEAVIERKKFEKLKEKKFSEYSLYKKRKERQIADEISTNFIQRFGKSIY